jgi:hypothetical protein
MPPQGNPENSGRRNHIEDLKKKLYTVDESLLPKRKEGILHSVPHQVSGNWTDADGNAETDMTQKKRRPKIFKKIFIFSMVFFLWSAIFAAYMFFRGSNTVSNDKVDVSVLGNAFTAGGTDLPLQIEITNKNSVPMQSADMLIEYPKGSDTANVSDYVRTRTSIGDIASGKTVVENATVVLFGEQGSTKDLKITIEYRVPDSNAVFVKDKTFTVNISSAPLSLKVLGTTQTTSAQPITLEVDAILNTEKSAPRSIVKVEYPSGFQFDSAIPKPTTGTNIWSLDSIKQGVPFPITINGHVFGQNGDEQSFHVYSGEEDVRDLSKINVVYASALHTLTLENSFLSANLILNDTRDGDVAARAGDRIRGTIEWSNNLDTNITDASVIAKFSGDAYDKTSVDTDGYYDSGQNEIVWDKNTVDELSSIGPKDHGTLSFTVSAKAVSQDKTPSFSISISIKGNKQGDNGDAQEVDSVVSRSVKLLSDIALDGSIAHDGGPFQNIGANPPQAEKETDYTVTWTARNTINLINKAEIRAKLPLYVKFTGATSPKGESVTFNDQTREVVWSLGTLARDAGANTNTRSVSFQVAVTPSLSQIGSAPEVVSRATFTGVDSFTNTAVQSSIRSLTTVTSDGSGDGKVVQ